ncbi:MFS transporter [Oceanobacillus sp. FSL H7-0719]|uniref:MFS transporter n=1 Tax=Oceanobacillus sp. FSL H7-0719 TaxID=2954507 RepID=UPI003245BA0E
MKTNKTNKWKNSLLLLLGIGVSNLGAWIYLIALNLIVLNMTGSPLAVAVLYILIPIAALCTNPWAGSFIDRLNKRNIMIFLDLSRALFIYVLSFMDSLLLIYILAFIINIASAIFEPASFVYMTRLVPTGERQRFNALRSFINSSGFILGPSVAGLLFMIGTVNTAIQLNALALLISAIIIFNLPDLEAGNQSIIAERVSLRVIRNDFNIILNYSKLNMYISLIYILFSGITVCMTALDSLEAAFATGVLSMTESTYGFLVSIAGIGIIVGSLINALLADRLNLKILLSFGAVFTPLGYVIFGVSNQFITASIGVFIITFALSFANTGILTFYQNNVPVDIMGRFSSVLGILEAMLIIVFTVMVGLFAELLDIRSTYTIGSMMFLIFGLMISFFVFDKTKKAYYR